MYVASRLGKGRQCSRQVTPDPHYNIMLKGGERGLLLHSCAYFLSFVLWFCTYLLAIS